MKYAFRWRERAVRQLRAIPQQTALTILQALTPLGDDPRRPDADIKKLAGHSDRYRLRVGDYRIRNIKAVFFIRPLLKNARYAIKFGAGLAGIGASFGQSYPKLIKLDFTG